MRQRDRVHVARASRDDRRTLTTCSCWCCSRPRFGRYWRLPCARSTSADDRPNVTSRGCGRNSRRTKQYLQSIVDNHEAASQELRAAHEEVLSSNEELQSTNEELETTKEELQSANEELDHRQRAVPVPQPRARRADGRPVEFHQQRRSCDGHGRPRSAHPAADAGGATSRSTCSRPTSAARSSTSSSRCDVDQHRRRSSTGGHRRRSPGTAKCATGTAAGGCCACGRS